LYLNADQLQRLVDESGNYRSLVLLLGVGGLRWGEAIALRVCDVDFLRRRVELHRNAVYVGGGFAVGSLKSNKNRGAPLPESTPVLPAGDSARAAPYGSIVGHLGGRESEGGPAHARPCQRGDDARWLR
jgi:integrase